MENMSFVKNGTAIHREGRSIVIKKKKKKNKKKKKKKKKKKFIFNNILSPQCVDYKGYIPFKWFRRYLKRNGATVGGNPNFWKNP